MGTAVSFGSYIPSESEDSVELFLLFYINGYEHGDTFMAEAAQSRLQVIKSSSWYKPEKHKVHCPPIQNISEVITIVANYIAKYGGITKAFSKEIGIFSHSGWDGPIGSIPASVAPEEQFKTQMMPPGWAQIEFNWVKINPKFVAFGCNSANTNLASKIFAKNLSELSNFLDVEVWGQSTSSFPSFVPDYRVTTVARSLGFGGWEAGKTYMVAGNANRGSTALCYSGVFDGSNIEHIQKEHDKANNLNCYKNGSKIRSTHQGYFHDHRKNI